MWHGGGQFSKTWESTPDGRDGYQNIFLQRGFSTYIIDEPRRGRAGRRLLVRRYRMPCRASQLHSTFSDLECGILRTLPALARYQFRQARLRSTSTGVSRPRYRAGSFGVGIAGYETKVSAVSALFDKTGAGVLLTHSASGGPGGSPRFRNNKVKGVIAYEPTEFVFPEGEVPTLLPALPRTTLAPLVVSPV